MNQLSIKQVIREHQDRFMSIPGIEGLGQGRLEGKPCITIFVSKSPAELRDQIPDSLEGYPVKIEETGTFQAQPGDLP